MERFWKYKLDHVVFWSATILFHMFTRAGLLDQAGAVHFLLEVLIRNSLLAAIIYTNLLVLIPAFVYRKKFLIYVISLATLIFLYAIAKNAHDTYLYGYVLGDPGKQDLFFNTFYNLSIALFYVAFSIALHLSREWYQQRELLRRIEIEKLNTELAYLKSQINPHFLFNSINTIYFQIDRNNTAARETLSSFSEMLRYQLYECNNGLVPVEKEIQYLKNYIDLQRLRKDENYAIEFSASDTVNGFSIAPLLLICLVENAFKHVSHHASENHIRVSADKIKDTFSLSVYNTRDHSKTIAEGGIGLKNVRRRLELLYPANHSLTIHETPVDFTVILALKISP